MKKIWIFGILDKSRSNSIDAMCGRFFCHLMRVIYSLSFVFVVYKLFFAFGASSLPEGSDYFFDHRGLRVFAIDEMSYVFSFFIIFYGLSLFWIRSLNYIGLSVWSFFVGIYFPYLLYPFDGISKIEVFADRSLAYLNSGFWDMLFLWIFVFVFLFSPVFVGVLLRKVKFMRVRKVSGEGQG